MLFTSYKKSLTPHFLGTIRNDNRQTQYSILLNHLHLRDVVALTQPLLNLTTANGSKNLMKKSENIWDLV